MEVAKSALGAAFARERFAVQPAKMFFLEGKKQNKPQWSRVTESESMTSKPKSAYLIVLLLSDMNVSSRWSEVPVILFVKVTGVPLLFQAWHCFAKSFLFGRILRRKF